MKKALPILFLLLVWFPGQRAAAQTPILQRVIYAEINHLRLGEALQQIAAKGNFNFSYDAALINADSIVTLKASGQTVQQLLDQLFRGRLLYKERGNYLILLKAPAVAAADKPKKKDSGGYVITGYVTDLETGKRLAYASVYDTSSMTSSFTDSSGFFRLPIPKGNKVPSSIGVSKQRYLDTVIIVQPATREVMEIRLSPRNTALALEPYRDPERNDVPMNNRSWVRYFTSARQRIAALNIGDLTGVRDWQVSFVPGFGTSGGLSSTVNYKFSFNILGGYTGGVDGGEIGGLFNLNRGDVKGAQVAGLFNASGGDVNAARIAGLLNLNYGKSKGVQVAGLINYCRDSVEGVEAAGLFNVNRSAMTGVQVAGLGNIQTRSLKGVQAAGLLNIADSANAQFSGLINVGGTIKGTQVSGLINAGKKVTGAQIGFLNIADTCNGTSIGFLSFVRSGIHQLELSTNEAVGLNLRFRTGTPYFYNIIAGGFHPVQGQQLLTAGYGIGTQIAFGQKAGMNVDFTGSQVFLGNVEQLNQLYRSEFTFYWQPHKKIGFFAGPAFSANLFDAGVQPDPSYAGQVAPYTSFSHDFANGFRFTAWPGFHAGIRLF